MSLGKLFVLLRRQTAIQIADPKTLVLLVAQPVFLGLMIVIAAPGEKLVSTKLFLGYIACIWLGCNNASPIIVRERAVFLREKSAGLSTFQYLLTKLFFVSVISTVQVIVLYAIIKFIGYGMVGSVLWQIGALWAAALTFSSIGLFISAVSSSNSQAAAIVPILVIPQILFSGWVFQLEKWKHARIAPMICRVIPAYSTQRLVDISFLWNRKIVEKDYTDRHDLEPHRENLEYAEIPLGMWWKYGGQSKDALEEEWKMKGAGQELIDQGEDEIRRGENEDLRALVTQGRTKVSEGEDMVERAQELLDAREFTIPAADQMPWYKGATIDDVEDTTVTVGAENIYLYDRDLIFNHWHKAIQPIVVLFIWFLGGFVLAWMALISARAD